MRQAEQSACFAGTVLQGSVAVGDTVELPERKQTVRIKSLQSFKQPVDRISVGDRAGMCVANLQSDGIERSFVSAPGAMRTVSSCVCAVEKCRFYKGATRAPRSCCSLGARHLATCIVSFRHVGGAQVSYGDAADTVRTAGGVKSGQKVYITVGHQTRMAKAVFFGVPDGEGCTQQQLVADTLHRMGGRVQRSAPINLHKEYQWQEALYGVEGAHSPAQKVVCGAL